MPYEPYVAVTLKKAVIKELDKTDPSGSRSTSAKVTEAIMEYVQARTPRPVPQTPNLGYLRLTGTPHSKRIGELRRG